MNKRLGWYLILGILVLLSYLAADTLAPRPKKIESKISHQPDSFSKNFTRITMTEEGKPKNKLFAESMVHFKDDDSTELEKPVFTHFSPNSPPWVIHSDRGLISSEGETILLSENVLITRNSEPGKAPVSINTKNLTIKPDTDYAETDQFAELVSNRNRVSGVGLSLYFGEHRKIELLSKVKGIYYAP